MTQNSKIVSVILVLLAAAGLNLYFSSPEVSFPRRSLSEFPKVLGDWTMVSDQVIDDKAMRILQVDDYFVRNYRNSRGEIVGLYVGYWKLQREGKGIHSPRQCLPGAGWLPIDTSVYQLPIEGPSGPGSAMDSSVNNSITHSLIDLPTVNRSTGAQPHSRTSDVRFSTVPVNKFIMGKGLDRQLYLFWYQGRGRTYASEYRNVIYLVWDALTQKRTDGALIRVNNDARGSADEALKTQTAFIGLFLPLLKEYVPE